MKPRNLWNLFFIFLVLSAIVSYFWLKESFLEPELSREEAYIRTCKDYLAKNEVDCQEFMQKWGQFMQK